MPLLFHDVTGLLDHGFGNGHFFAVFVNDGRTEKPFVCAMVWLV